jgi:two-component system chemotaxis sensor kinase CheA
MSTADSFRHLVQDFVDETLPLAEAAAREVLDLERAWAEPALPDAVLGPLRSHLHTVKGNAAMMGLDAVANVAHALEDVLAMCAELPAPRPARTVDILLRGADLLCGMVRAAARGGGPGVDEQAPLAVAAAGSAASTVRIDFGRLDELLAQVGELQSTAGALRAALGAHAGDVALETGLAALDRTGKALRRLLLEARLMPMSTLFARFPRYLRDLSRARGQALRLETVGGDVPIDKSVIDRLGEPLVHLVRNAVAHVLEPPDERRRLGKPVEGTITLGARLEGSQAVVWVADDGRGLDEARIAARARAIGLPVDGLAPAELRRLVFVPGFSTAERISDLAGRGVGLDAVGAALHALGGSVDVDSRPGAGCTFSLAVPVTLVLLRGLLCSLGGEPLVVPAAAVAEVVALGRDRPTLLPWRGALVGVVSAAALLGDAAAAPRGPAVALVLQAGARRRALVVDRVLTQLEVVVQPLPPPLGRLRWFSGATVLGMGAVALILDAARVVDGDAGRRAPEAAHVS